MSNLPEHLQNASGWLALIAISTLIAIGIYFFPRLVRLIRKMRGAKAHAHPSAAADPHHPTGGGGHGSHDDHGKSKGGMTGLIALLLLILIGLFIAFVVVPWGISFNESNLAQMRPPPRAEPVMGMPTIEPSDARSIIAPPKSAERRSESFYPGKGRFIRFCDPVRNPTCGPQAPDDEARFVIWCSTRDRAIELPLDIDRDKRIYGCSVQSKDETPIPLSVRFLPYENY